MSGVVLTTDEAMSGTIGVVGGDVELLQEPAPAISMTSTSIGATESCRSAEVSCTSLLTISADSEMRERPLLAPSSGMGSWTQLDP